MLLWIHDTRCEAKLICAKFLMLGNDLSVWDFLRSMTLPWLLMIFQSSMTFDDFSRKFYFSRFSRPCGNPSASQSRKSWVAQRTIHGGSLGGPCNLWVVCIRCGQKWQWNNNIVMCYLFLTSNKKHEIDISNSPITLKFDRRHSSNDAKSCLSYFRK